MSQEKPISANAIGRRHITVTGVVQGVGFRPFVYALAQRCDLGGHVGNDSGGVFIEIEGRLSNLDRFQQALLSDAPPLAHIEQVTAVDMRPSGEQQFSIVHSQDHASASTMLSPDVCICDDCLRETLDPADRRHRYPFTNCTNCGPRFTIIRDIPYDRPLTTMSAFTMCAECQTEYDDPLNRRFHAQPNACSACGPHIWLELSGSGEAKEVGDEARLATQRLLAEGRVVSIKGVGGFHLACDALNDEALALLRQRKGRVDKPFAVMAGDLDTARRVAQISDGEAAVLMSKERPILLLRKRHDSPASDLIAPGNRYIGVMLPYTPLHYLLFDEHPFHLPLLVMTSGNYSDEPIVKGNEEARQVLSGLADAFLMHNRDIEARCDDSVVRVWRGTELPIRRSRGYAPYPVRLPFDAPQLLAVGGELKATFCVANGHFAYMSQHIGDMENLETLQAFEAAAKQFRHIFRIEPKRLACDLHPGYLSTRWALAQETQLPVVRVQHHHAHIAAVMAEHQAAAGDKVLGFSFDGTGYGTDGAIWGGEFLLAGYDGFERLAHWDYMPLPGGDAAIKRPYRQALAYLWAAGIEWDERLAPVAACPPAERAVLRRQLETGLNTVPTSSMGRLFDVMAALTGVRQEVTYEGQAAIEFEALAQPECSGSYRIDFADGVIDTKQIVHTVVHDVLAGAEAAHVAARFHRAIADLMLRLSILQRDAVRVGTVALSGGVFQNVTLLDLAVPPLEKAGFRVLVHRKVPPNDGGLALGQAAVAAHSPPP